MAKRTSIKWPFSNHNDRFLIEDAHLLRRFWLYSRDDRLTNLQASYCDCNNLTRLAAFKHRRCLSSVCPVSAQCLGPDILRQLLSGNRAQDLVGTQSRIQPLVCCKANSETYAASLPRERLPREVFPLKHLQIH